MRAVLPEPFMLGHPRDLDEAARPGGIFDTDAELHDLVRRWIDGEWTWRFAPDQASPRSSGDGYVHVVAESRLDYRLSQQFVFSGGELLFREVLFIDPPRGIELRIKLPPTDNQCAEFRHKPFQRLAEAVLNLGIVDLLGADEKIVGDRLSEVRS